jgi:acyl carrier protein
MSWILFLIFGVMAVVFIRYEGWRKNRKMEAAFAGRRALRPAEFYERFFRAQGVAEEVVTGVRRVLEQQLGVDLSRLVASDDFTQNIGFFFEFDSMADVEIVCALEKEFAIKITDEEAANMRTIQNMVDLVWSKRKAGA